MHHSCSILCQEATKHSQALLIKTPMGKSNCDVANLFI